MNVHVVFTLTFFDLDYIIPQLKLITTDYFC